MNNLLSVTLVFILILFISRGLEASVINEENTNGISSQIIFQPGSLEELTVPSDWPFDKKSQFLARHKQRSIGDNGITHRTKSDCVFYFQIGEKIAKNIDKKGVGTVVFRSLVGGTIILAVTQHQLEMLFYLGQ